MMSLKECAVGKKMGKNVFLGFFEGRTGSFSPSRTSFRRMICRKFVAERPKRHVDDKVPRAASACKAAFTLTCAC
jgi:hypothetical protein